STIWRLWTAMTPSIDDTHDPARKSWVESANRPGCDFPIQNLPLGVFIPPSDVGVRVGVAIGDFILDVSKLTPPTLEQYFTQSQSTRADLRKQFVKVLESGSPQCELYRQAECTMLLPARIGDYTDFYASIHHATNVGKLLRPDNPLLPNYKYVPIGYHGRSSSIVLSGAPVRRPKGQRKPDASEPVFGSSQSLDYE